MKLKIFSKKKEKLEEFKKKIKKHADHFSLSEKPEVIICYGGDGTFLHAERAHPGIPKLIVRDQSICKLCNEGKLEYILEKLFKKEYQVIKQNKVEAIINNKKILASNDVVIRNKEQIHAIRFNIETNTKKSKEKHKIINVIGDGVVISTPFGSTGYFHSITKKSFKEGIGLAFNNTTIQLEPLMTHADIKFKLLRNEAILTRDNAPEKILIKENDKVIIRESKQQFKIIKI